MGSSGLVTTSDAISPSTSICECTRKGAGRLRLTFLRPKPDENKTRRFVFGEPGNVLRSSLRVLGEAYARFVGTKHRRCVQAAERHTTSSVKGTVDEDEDATHTNAGADISKEEEWLRRWHRGARPVPAIYVGAVNKETSETRPDGENSSLSLSLSLSFFPIFPFLFFGLHFVASPIASVTPR